MKSFESPLVSVIVPVYNVERYLNKCIESILKQSYLNIEVLLIDDGSTDKSSIICDDFRKRDSRIKVVHQKNQGVTKARANGVKSAYGKWILFVDSDDTLPCDAIDNMIKADGDNDIIVGQVNFSGPYLWPYAKNKQEYNRESYLRALLQRHKIHSGPVAKLFKRSLFDDFSFDIPPKITCGEDFIMNLRLANKAEKILVIETIVYNYLYRAGSAISKDPFTSISYVLLYNRLISASIRPSSFMLKLCMLSNYIRRMIVWLKRNTIK